MPEFIEKTSKHCPECRGAGGWEDAIAQQSIICPFCRPVAAESYAMENVELPGWVTSRWREHEASYYGPALQIYPWLLVIHSPIYSNKVASYFASKPVDKRGYPRRVSTQLSREDDRYEQSVPFNHVAHHCGGSLYKGNRRLNYCSHGIETIRMGAKWTVQEKDTTRAALVYMVEINPYQVIVPHSFIDPSRQDPGKFFPWEICEDLGAELPHLR